MAVNTSEREPLIVVILGCTGTGKSKLSIEIGRKVGGEIISADSMQVYKGLDIITNKVTAEERAIIPHHLLDFVEANEKFSVVEFKTLALDVIADILKRQKIPIIVGGTNYYIESFLWDSLIDEKHQSEIENEKIRSKFQKVENEERKEASPARESGTFVEEGGNVETRSREDEKRQRDDDDENTIVKSKKTSMKQTQREELGSLKGIAVESRDSYEETSFAQQIIDTESPAASSMPFPPRENINIQDSLHQQLAKVDSVMAQKLHPNDTRKIKRSLQVYKKSGIAHSEHIAQQHSQEGSSEHSGPMRFKNVCVLWLQCEFETLDKRLDTRVDQMIEQGLVNELIEFHNSWKQTSTNSKVQNNEGIFQSIGFKEFREFLNLGECRVEEHPELFQKCVEAMKCATRRYARKQVRWVNNRFLGRPSTSAPDVYGLNATDLGQWECDVLEQALDIVKSFRTGEKVHHVPLERIVSSSAAKHSNHTCTVCNDRVIIGDHNWEAHLRSRSHRHYKKKQT